MARYETVVQTVAEARDAHPAMPEWLAQLIQPLDDDAPLLVTYEIDHTVPVHGALHAWNIETIGEWARPYISYSRACHAAGEEAATFEDWEIPLGKPEGPTPH